MSDKVLETVGSIRVLLEEAKKLAIKGESGLANSKINLSLAHLDTISTEMILHEVNNKHSGDKMPEEPDAPFKSGEWVSKFDEDRPLFGKVKNVYKNFMEPGGWLIDLVVYHADGRKIGRESEPLGGPRSFEPALEAEMFMRINKPELPIYDSDFNNRYGEYATKIGAVKEVSHAPKP